MNQINKPDSNHLKNIKIQHWSVSKRLISWLLIIALLNLSGCMNYFKVRKTTGPAEDTIKSIYNQPKTLVVHLDYEAWYLENYELTGKELKGELSKKYIYTLKNPLKKDGTNRYRKNKRNNIDESYVLNEVHIYVNELSRENVVNSVIPLKAIEKIEIYEKDKAATVGSWTLGSLGVAALTYAVVVIIVLLTKSSCPFIYIYDGEDYKLAGEIFSGTIQPSLERHDFLKLKLPDIHQSQFQLKIANEVKEIQHTNLLELWTFDHKNDIDVCVDKYGNVQTFSTLISPTNAVNAEGKNITGMLSSKDDLIYTSADNEKEMPLVDGIIMEFPKPEKSNTAKLALRAKNSYVLDFMLGEFQNEFGSIYKTWQKKQRKVPAEQLQNWSLSQNIPLSVFIERNGEWEFIDYYNLAGPVALKEDVLSFPLTGEESDPLKIKLEFGNFFWEIDYAAIDYSENLDLNYSIAPIKSAISQDGKNVCKTMLRDDNRYYNQPKVGDYAVIDFNLPPLSDEQRTVVLHSKGWYKILRDPEGKPDIEYLETFRQPGRFNQFVNDYLQKLASD